MPLLLLSATLRGQAPESRPRNLDVAGSAFERKTSKVDAELSQFDESGVVLKRAAVALTLGQNRVSVLPNARRLRIESPVLDGCEIDLGLPELACRLEQKAIIRPFQGRGAVWVRKKGDEHFRLINPLSEEPGDRFALSKGVADLVLAPEGRCATLRLKTAVGLAVPTAQPPPNRPAAVQARLVTSQGTALRDQPRLEVALSPTPTRAPPTPELQAWREFFQDVGVKQSKDGTVAITPTPCEPTYFLVRFPRRRPATLSTLSNVSGTFDMGEIPLPELATLSVSIEDLRDPPSDLHDAVLSGMLLRPAQGLTLPGPLSRKVEVSLLAAREGPVNVDLFPGEWLLALRERDHTIGERRIMAMEGDNLSDVFTLRQLRVAGRVESASGKAVPNARVDILFITDALSPLARLVTDDEGRFSTSTLHGGGALLVTVVPGKGGIRQQSVDPSKDDVENLRIRLGAGTVIVDVRAEGGREPVPDIAVTASFEQDQTVFRLSATSGDDGRATFRDLDDGNFSVTSAANDLWYAEEASLGGKRRVSGDSPNLTSTVFVKPARRVIVSLSGDGSGGAKVVGQLTAGSGKYPATVVADASGTALLTLPRNQGGLFVVVAPGRRLSFFQLAPSEDKVRIELRPRRVASTLEFTLSESDYRNPFGVLVSAFGVPIPTAVLSPAMSTAGCSLAIPPLSGQAQFDQCLEDGVYEIQGLDLATRRPFGLVPRLVEIGEGARTAIAQRL